MFDFISGQHIWWSRHSSLFSTRYVQSRPGVPTSAAAQQFKQQLFDVFLNSLSGIKRGLIAHWHSFCERCAGLRGSFCERGHKAQHQQQQRAPRQAVVARITGKRDEYVIEGIQDPEDVWGEEAENEFIEVGKHIKVCGLLCRIRRINKALTCTKFSQEPEAGAAVIHPTVVSWPCEWLQVDNVPMWSPERGQYNERIFRDADEERDTKDISIEDTAYWFSENNCECPAVGTSAAAASSHNSNQPRGHCVRVYWSLGKQRWWPADSTSNSS